MTVNRDQHVKQSHDLHKEHVQKIDSSIPYTAPPTCGVSYELCAGIVDKQTSLEEIAKEEVFEECGYDVPLGDIKRVSAWRGGLGTSCNMHTLFYVEVTDAMLVLGAGGGNVHEGEQIELFYLPVGELRSFMYNEDIAKECSLLFALSWWIENVQKA
jgi:UDP-sugar diphosphatase